MSIKQFIEDNKGYYAALTGKWVAHADYGNCVKVSDLEAYMEGKVVVDAEAYKNLLECKQFIQQNWQYICHLLDKEIDFLATQEGE